MADAKVKTVPLHLVEIDTQSGTCPWCNYSNNDEMKGPLHTKVTDKYVVRNVGQTFQCDSCGKNWAKQDLGKSWTMELERGAAWAKTQAIRELRASGGIG